jgi:hypothetical protein
MDSENEARELHGPRRKHHEDRDRRALQVLRQPVPASVLQDGGLRGLPICAPAYIT